MKIQKILPQITLINTDLFFSENLRNPPSFRGRLCLPCGIINDLELIKVITTIPQGKSVFYSLKNV